MSDLAREPAREVGDQVFVEEDGITYISIGRLLPAIAARINWPATTVWAPDHVVQYVQAVHPVLPDPIRAGAHIIERCTSVHANLRAGNQCYFIVDGTPLRSVGLLTSRSTPYVDAVVELRTVPGGTILRLFHLSPTTRTKGGTQVWP